MSSFDLGRSTLATCDAVQVRPIDAVPGHGTKVCTACQDNQVTVFQEDQVVYSATYDHVYDQNSEQVIADPAPAARLRALAAAAPAAVPNRRTRWMCCPPQGIIFSDCCLPLIHSFFDGYNATILAYGQTGSGKTFTMGTADTSGVGDESLGIIPRAIGRVFEDVDERQEQISITVKASFLEIYNEEIKDLLAPGGRAAEGRQSIMIRESPDGSINVNGLTEVVVSSCADTLALLQTGATSRTTGSTLMNSVSSRSHGIFTLSLEQRFPPADGSAHEEVRLSKFHFVDLAGSERQKRTKATGDRLKEGISINCGLLALGNVISVLGDPMKKGSHVPYRDSRLTRMLQDSLGGNSKTVFIGCVSPAFSDMDESKNSLRYANRARNIQNKAVVNVDAASSDIMLLRQRVAQLEATLAQNGIAIPEDTSGFASGGGGGAMTISTPGVDRPAYMAMPRVNPGGGAAGVGVGNAWVDTDEIPLPAPSSLGADALPDQSVLDLDDRALEPDLDDVDGGSEMIAPPRGAGPGEEDDLALELDEEMLEEDDDIGPPTPEQKEKAVKYRKQLMSLETKLQQLETERRQAEAMLLHSKKERDSEAQQHALRVAVLEKEIGMVTQEMVRITTDATRNQMTKDSQTVKVKQQLEEKLAQMKHELTELRTAYKDTQKKLSAQRSSTEHIQNLQSAITGIKEEKAKLLRRMREEKTQNREKAEQERRNSAHLQKSLNRKSWEVTKLKAEKERQGLILERKKEEVQLNKQKLVELQQKMRTDHMRDRPRSAAMQSSSFQTSLRNRDEQMQRQRSGSSRTHRAGSTQRKQHRQRQQKVRKLAKQLVSAATRRSGLKETVKRERSTRDAAVQALERLYEAKMDTDSPELDDEILRYEEEIDAKNQTIAAMHDAMNDEDLSDTTSLLATLPVEDHGDLITILVEIAARDPNARATLDDADSLADASATPGKKTVARKKGRRPSSEPRRRTPRRNSEGGADDPSAIADGALDGEDSGEDDTVVTTIGGSLPVRVHHTDGLEPEPEPDASGVVSISQIPIPGTSRTSPAKPGRSRSPPAIPVPGGGGGSLPSARGSVGGSSARGKAKRAASEDADTSGHSVFDRLSEPGEKPKPVSHRDGIYVAATRREKSKSSESGGGSASRRSFQFKTTLVGHRGAVYDAATNESCTKVYSASQDTTVLEWDVETSQITAVCEGHQGFVRAVVVASGDGDSGGGGSALGGASGSPELALSGAQDSCIKLWDMRAPHSSRCVATLTEHSAEVCFLSVVGDKLFSGSADATVKYWDIRQRKCVDTLRGHKSTVFAVAAACKPGETEPCMCAQTALALLSPCHLTMCCLRSASGCSWTDTDAAVVVALAGTSRDRVTIPSKSGTLLSSADRQYRRIQTL
eukprot:COSAG06_NODE_952_length_11333_cov_2.718355_5_plen_1388_part_00